MYALIEGLSYVLNPSHFPFLFIGVAGGIVVGALPGLTGSVGIILLLPFLYYLEPATALIMLSGMFCGAIYGGSISAILISTPGTPSAAATVLDGYPLAEKGEAGKAIGVATIASTMGGIISTLCMIFISPQLAKFALKFGPEEYFALMVFGLTVIASVSGASLVKGLISGFFGLLIASIGIDQLTGYARFSFDIPSLMTGFPMLPVLIGLFAISQIFIELGNVGKKLRRYDQKIKGVLPTWGEFKRLVAVIIPASFLGTFIGIIPGTGGAIASFMAYNEARRFSKDPDSFGKGNLCRRGCSGSRQQRYHRGGNGAAAHSGGPGGRSHRSDAGSPDADRRTPGTAAVRAESADHQCTLCGFHAGPVPHSGPWPGQRKGIPKDSESTDLDTFSCHLRALFPWFFFLQQQHL